MSVRRLKPDPLPEGAIDKILEAGRWAMSGANGQPWEFIVVTDPALKKDLYRVYQEEMMDYNFWMERMRLPELRHPAFQLAGEPDEQMAIRKEAPGWDEAPALIVVLGDGRRQWATVMGGHTLGRHQSHLTDGLANTCMLIHLAASSIGLGTQWVTIHIEDHFKRVLDVPDVMTFYSIIPVGYPAAPPKKNVRRPLKEMVHSNKYDRGKHLSNRQVVDYITNLRRKTMAKYKSMFED
jgi:nitroreductase